MIVEEMINQMEDGGVGTGYTQYITVYISGQLFGMAIEKVHDVFMPTNVTRVPLSSGQIGGVLNLRGRIVTVIDMRHLLHLPTSSEENHSKMAVGVEFRGESYGLVIDSVGEVLTLNNNEKEPNPANLDRKWAEYASGIHRLKGELLVILNVERILSNMNDSTIAA